MLPPTPKATPKRGASGPTVSGNTSKINSTPSMRCSACSTAASLPRSMTDFVAGLLTGLGLACIVWAVHTLKVLYLAAYAMEHHEHGTLFLSHVEDEAVFDRYIDAI